MSDFAEVLNPNLLKILNDHPGTASEIVEQVSECNKENKPIEVKVNGFDFKFVPIGGLMKSIDKK